RKALERLIGVVDGAVHAVAEAELASQMYRESAGSVDESRRFDLFDQLAVIALAQLGRHRLLQVEALSEDERRGHYLGKKLASWISGSVTASTSGGTVMASSVRSSTTRREGPVRASSISVRICSSRPAAA